jgi:hypothetical protein
MAGWSPPTPAPMPAMSTGERKEELTDEQCAGPQTVPFLKPYVDALAAGEPLPPFARQQLGFGSAQDAAGVVAFLASDAAASITGQAVGIGGDRLALWSHPTEAVVEFADGTGWSADAIAGM